MTLHIQLRNLISASGRSMREIAGTAGIPYTRLHSALTNESNMRFEDVASLACVLKVSLDELAGTPTNIREAAIARRLLNGALELAHNEALLTQNVDLETFLDWWHSTRGRLENWDKIKPAVDLFRPPGPEAKRIDPIDSGPRSLASIAFHVSDAEGLAKTLEGFSGDFNDALIGAHIQAYRSNEPVLSHITIDQELPDGERCVRTYRRVLAPVTNADGQRLIANFSQDLRV
ncbi:helix-turn-helix domain-containing protein [Salipiger thiooxidans]|uniref:helix-turn-helix domain-containing protein n=1 Tax=Salipiger thiooxidans TaxID=282683 RepID=UPI001CFA7104|nr:helix-turn-helix transcriptional regulator [Salipiger thiooxidans]